MKKLRYIPFGYRIRNGRTVVELTEAEIVRKIYEEYIRGASLKDIAEELTVRRVPYTEKTDQWNKARIARIIDNARYMGSGEYDPIIDEDTFEEALHVKESRTNSEHAESEEINFIRSRVKCAVCGYPMVRHICSRQKIKERWICTNPDCGIQVKITDTDLLAKITILINRIIENTDLILPPEKGKPKDSPAVAEMQRQIDMELTRDHPSESYILEKISNIAARLYEETQAEKQITAQKIKKQAAFMESQKVFNREYFNRLIAYLTLDESGKAAVFTKTDIKIEEGESADGCS